MIEENDVIVENNKPQTTNHKLTYVSPEKLLASVENSQENISITHSKKTNNSIKVNPNSLLSSVENEIKEEYRETTFDKLKRKFNETKSAVAGRQSIGTSTWRIYFAKTLSTSGVFISRTALSDSATAF